MRDVLVESFDLVSEAFMLVPDELFLILVSVGLVHCLITVVHGLFDGFYGFDFPSDDSELECPVGDISNCPYGCKSYDSDFCEKFCMFMEDDYASN